MDDGTIKYTSVRRAGAIPRTPQLDALNQARTALFDLGLIGAYPSGIGYGNLSIRTCANQFIITASATGGERILGVDQYCLVESFSPQENCVASLGPLPASSESMTHGAIYSTNSSVHCVIHAHSRSLFGRLLTGNHLMTAGDIPYGTPAMARAVAELVTRQPSLPILFAMAGHDEGVVAYGADVGSVCRILVDAFHGTTAI